MTRQFEVPTEHQSYLDLKVQGSPPATPASGYLRVYGNADKTVHAIDDTGSDPTGGGGASENVVDHGDLGASETFDYGDGANHQGTVTAALTLTLAGWSSAGPPATADRLVARLTNDGTGGYGVPTLGGEVVNAADWAAVWDDAAGALNEVVFESWDGGTTVYIANLPLPIPNIEDLATAETDTALVYAPDGSGGVVARAESGGSGIVSGVDRVETDQSDTHHDSNWYDLATAGPAVTLTVPASGKVRVFLSCYFYTTDQNKEVQGGMSFAVSGANTIAAVNTKALVFPAPGNADGATDLGLGTSFLLTGLTPGSTTFTAKYSCLGGSGTAHFLAREISVETR